MHQYELFATGVVTCYAYPIAEACDATLPYKVPVDLPIDDGEIESAIDKVVTRKGWCTYRHPGGMRYSPQWYCPRHVEAIVNVPDDAEDQFARNLKDHLWPEQVKRKPHQPVMDLKVGERVVHDKYGTGIVQEVTGSHGDVDAVINFGSDHGTKCLVLRYAPLRRLEE